MSASLEAQMAVLTERVERQNEMLRNVLANHEEIMKRHDRILMGNGSDAGLMSHVSKLCDNELDRKWSMRLIWTTVLGLVGKFLYDMMNTKHP